MTSSTTKTPTWFKVISMIALLYLVGHSFSDNVTIVNIWKDYYNQIVAGKIDTMTIEAANEFRATQKPFHLPPPMTALPGSPRAEDLQSDDELNNIQCPVFLQYGENDKVVDLQTSIRNYQERIPKTAATTIKIYKRGNHSCMTPEWKICTGLLDDKINWLQKIGVL